MSLSAPWGRTFQAQGGAHTKAARTDVGRGVEGDGREAWTKVVLDSNLATGTGSETGRWLWAWKRERRLENKDTQPWTLGSSQMEGTLER